jgi:hypothetical protein
MVISTSSTSPGEDVALRVASGERRDPCTGEAVALYLRPAADYRQAGLALHRSADPVAENRSGEEVTDDGVPAAQRSVGPDDPVVFGAVADDRVALVARSVRAPRQGRLAAGGAL